MALAQHLICGHCIGTAEMNRNKMPRRYCRPLCRYMSKGRRHKVPPPPKQVRSCQDTLSHRGLSMPEPAQKRKITPTTAAAAMKQMG